MSASVFYPVGMKLVAFVGYQGQRVCVAIWKVCHRAVFDRATHFLFQYKGIQYTWITVPLTVKTKRVLHQTGINRETVQILTIHCILRTYLHGESSTEDQGQTGSKPFTK